MELGKFRENSVKIGNDKKLCMSSGNPLAVVTTTNEIQPAFSGGQTYLIISELYRRLMDIAQVLRMRNIVSPSTIDLLLSLNLYRDKVNKLFHTDWIQIKCCACAYFVHFRA